MTPLPPELEALMPEPVAWTLNQELQQRETTCKAHMWFVDPQNTSWAPLHTADQVREAIKAATERAAKVVEDCPPPLKPQGCRVEIGENARKAFATAIRGGGREG